jgi:hypothetical protein
LFRRAMDGGEGDDDGEVVVMERRVRVEMIEGGGRGLAIIGWVGRGRMADTAVGAAVAEGED